MTKAKAISLIIIGILLVINGLLNIIDRTVSVKCLS